ncbi:hypothetical protein [Thermocoleostomius sinensis]|jgi:hypothetical protein|uniref:Uncharacterized protein n=1 Tax=Thermocoleostomius sinensis A174 TaxID=2016057 RepID=A0A9E8ZH80_9CYAN|nr:hypothetical protein [Thermocoleostomius sinensis]WAL62706.1 hypothetical protein OXH18_12150 [Thermocoleostomius sinensis A174]
MSNTSRSEKTTASSVERTTVGATDPTFNFDQWAGAVKQQMLAALKRRERMRSAWD